MGDLSPMDTKLKFIKLITYHQICQIVKKWVNNTTNGFATYASILWIVPQWRIYEEDFIFKYSGPKDINMFKAIYFQSIIDIIKVL
jgi:hypothetical protein